MAWERNFEAKVLKIREKELRYQKLNYTIEVCALELRYSLELPLNQPCLGALECYLVFILMWPATFLGC